MEWRALVPVGACNIVLAQLVTQESSPLPSKEYCSPDVSWVFSIEDCGCTCYDGDKSSYYQEMAELLVRASYW